MTINDVQQVCLDILREFHTFCKENNLRYSLEGGTLLGAIRHKGFIPWDNDVDVMMPRPDYNRFVALYQNNENFSCFADARKNCYIAYARLAEMKRTLVKPGIVWADRETGVWIDIFPVDGVANTKSEFVQTIHRVFTLWRKTCLSRDAMGSFSTCKSLYKKVKLVAKKMLYHNSVYRFLYQHIQLCQKYDYATSEHVGILAFSGDENKYLPHKMMDSYMEVPYEDTSLCVVKDYDVFLKMAFGDYMQLPPVEERFVHDMHCYYWKE